MIRLYSIPYRNFYKCFCFHSNELVGKGTLSFVQTQEKDMENGDQPFWIRDQKTSKGNFRMISQYRFFWTFQPHLWRFANYEYILVYRLFALVYLTVNLGASTARIAYQILLDLIVTFRHARASRCLAQQSLMIFHWPSQNRRYWLFD